MSAKQILFKYTYTNTSNQQTTDQFPHTLPPSLDQPRPNPSMGDEYNTRMANASAEYWQIVKPRMAKTCIHCSKPAETAATVGPIMTLDGGLSGQEDTLNVWLVSACGVECQAKATQAMADGLMGGETFAEAIEKAKN